MRAAAIGLAALVAALALGLALSAAPGGQYRLVWADEFDGDALDTGKWQAMHGDGCQHGICGWGNDEQQYYLARNAVVGGGTLKIVARRESAGGKDYTSARLRTLGRGDWRHGRFVMRARLPAGQGIWPAFWMLPSADKYGGWAASGEIDIMELVGHEPDRVHGTLHYGGQWPDNVHSGHSHRLAHGSFADAFHEFALEWDAQQMRWYVDGRLYASQSQWWSGGGPYPAPFDERFHLLLNLAVGGRWPGNPDRSTRFPQVLEVDWVRVYQRVDADERRGGRDS